MLTDWTFEVVVMGLSLICVLCAYLLIYRRDGSWINWATPSYIFALSANYVFPFAVLFISGATGSKYSYAYCYTTYAVSALAGAAGYLSVKPTLVPPRTLRPLPDVGLLPWLLLIAAVLLYMPVIIEFRDSLLHPRDIYVQTRTGYGLYFFGSSALANVAFVTYLFKKHKSFSGALVFYVSCITLVFLHGSKGQLLTLAYIRVLYWVYVQSKKVRLIKAFISVALLAGVGMASFAIFADFSDTVELLTFMRDYSDYTRNAMLVIDDSSATIYSGQLVLESEIYSRVPRLIMPDKPKDFGIYKLARIYYPASFRADAGSPDFGIGLQYADFGPFAILYICFWSALTGWLVATLVRSLRRQPRPATFVIFLFFSGIVILPIGSGYLLPETLLLAWSVSLALRFRLMPKKTPLVRLITGSRGDNVLG